jgi:hypothetical protein
MWSKIMKTTIWIVLGSALLLPAPACNGGGGTSDDAGQDTPEIPEEFILYVELVPAVGYNPALDANTITMTIGTDPPVVFEDLSIPAAGPYVYSFEMEPAQSAEVATVRADGYRAGVEAVISTGRCGPVRLGEWTVDPVTGTPKTLKLFFHKMETFSLVPESGDMVFGRVGHRAAVLSDGRVAVLGGATSAGLTRVVEIFDLPALTFQTTTVELPSARSEFAMPGTGAGEWLLVGGRTSQNAAHRMTEEGGVMSFEEVPLPEQLLGVWGAPRAAALSDGTFILGGADAGADTPSSVYALYDRVAGFSILSMTAPSGDPVELDKVHPTLTPIDTAEGQRVLLYGGGGAFFPALILDPATGELVDGQQAALDMRVDHAAAVTTMRSADGSMENQLVLILGGEEKVDETTTRMAQNIYLFAPACLEGPCVLSAPWSNAGPAFADPYGAKSGAVAVLPGSRALYIGGRDGSGQTVCNVMDVRAGTSDVFPVYHLSLAVARVAPEVVWYEATEQLFVIGGEGEGGVPLASMEVFTPQEP